MLRREKQNGRDWLQRFLLSLPRHEDRPARWKCEISTIDTTYLLAGALTAACYFNRDTKSEREIRALAESLYKRADWQWAQNGALTVSHGWKPETRIHQVSLDRIQRSSDSVCSWSCFADVSASAGELSQHGPGRTSGRNSTATSFSTPVHCSFITCRTCGSTSAASRTNTCAVRRSIISRTAGGRSMRSRPMRCGIRRSLLGYDRFRWGITASDGPGPAERRINGRRVRFFDYKARSIPYGPDDGTLAPWAVAASLPFAPEVVLAVAQTPQQRLSGDHERVRIQVQLQSDVHIRKAKGLGFEGILRSGSGTDRDDDRKLPIRFDLAIDASLSFYH